MRYRIKRKEIKESKIERSLCRRASADSPRRLFGRRYDEIDLSALFEEKKKGAKPRKSVLSTLKERFLTLICLFCARACEFFEKRRKKPLERVLF